MQTNQVERNILIDILKGFAIIAVVFDHIPGLFNLPYEANLNLFIQRFLTSFNMPLFAVISGYLLANTVRKHNITYNVIRKLKLLIPLAIFALLSSVMNIVFGKIELLAFPEEFLYRFLNQFWFIWAMFWCTLLIILIYFLSGLIKQKRVARIARYIAYTIILIIAFSSIELQPIFTGQIRYLLLYFILGFEFGIDKDKMLFQRINKKGIMDTVWIGLLLPLIILFSLSFLYTSSINIYINSMSISYNNFPQQLIVDIYRYILCLTNTCCVILIFRYINIKYAQNMVYRKISKLLCSCGKRTLQIYMIHIYVLNYLIQPIINHLSLSYHDIYTFLVGIIAIGITLLLIKILEICHIDKIVFAR
jgi:fucose 4-O-acetylase-like acetyltransferase